MTAIHGIGWVHHRHYGCVGLRTEGECPADSEHDTPWLHSGVFAAPVRNFARFPTAVQTACVVGALALRDAGLSASPGNKLPAAVLGTRRGGCWEDNEAYYRDYIQSGRTLARGAMFVYTLPTSGLAEAAIHLGCNGPLLFVEGTGDSTPALLRMASGMIERRETRAALVMNVAARQAVGFWVAGEEALGPEAPLCTLDDAADAAAGKLDPLIARVRKLERGR